MAKPRIIIADTEFEYITRLQAIFVDEFFDKIDLEIVTDEIYFDTLFSTPQKVDVLIVSEELYNYNLQRHNISDIFVMTENLGEDRTDDLNIQRLGKYTTKKNVINEIVSKSKALVNLSGNIKKDTEIIVVTSACGGVGKTTVARGICTSLTKNHKRVLYINAERLQTYQRFLKNQTSINSSDVYSNLVNEPKNTYEILKYVIRAEEFNYLPPFKSSLMSLGLSYKIYERIATGAKESKDYDFIVIDTDSIFDEEKASLINIADKVIVVTSQTETAVYATNVFVSNINGINGEKYIFICNQFDKEKYNALVSPEIHAKFSISEYVEVMSDCDRINNEELSKEKDVQKIAFLIM